MRKSCYLIWIYIYLRCRLGNRCRVETSGRVENVHPAQEARYLTLRFQPVILGEDLIQSRHQDALALNCVCRSDLRTVQHPGTSRKS
ncbi:hypothetical protein NSPZN2_30116 [Nitrospira defluvii]|uniref:Secreted protein n=1 Tax=Nitrospira defluvii TaxID=330214 RepID=A0ABM8RFC9_9BACT|nr:hypothetical protein NSPZN2_30116 [Nitrospira defluvii]